MHWSDPYSSAQAFGNIAFGPDGNSLYFSAYIYLIDQKKALGNVKNQRQRKPRNS